MISNDTESGRTKYTEKNSCLRQISKSQTRKLANKRTTYRGISFLKLIGNCIYIYSLSSYLAVDTVSVRKSNGRMIDMETVAFNFENEHKHINALRRQRNVLFSVLKLAVCTPIVRVFNDNYPSLTLSCLTWNDPSNCH